MIEDGADAIKGEMNGRYIIPPGSILKIGLKIGLAPRGLNRLNV